MTPRISVVIPAFNAQSTVGDTVRAVINQPLPPGTFECIVIDDCSTDRTAEAAQTAGATVVRSPKNLGAAAARNAGIERARAEWIAFADADAVPSRRWLVEILNAAHTADASILAVAGKTLGLDSQTPAARFIDLIGALDAETYLKSAAMAWAPSCNVAYRREHLLAVGGFDASFKTYEAADLHLRLVDRFGGRTQYVPTAIILHRHRRTWRAFWKQQRNYGVGYAQFFLKHANRWPWSLAREFGEWRRIAGFAARACITTGDQSLVQRGFFIKCLAQRIGFVSTYFLSRPKPRQISPIKEPACLRP